MTKQGASDHLKPHGLFLSRTKLFHRQGAKFAKANKIDVSACGEITLGDEGAPPFYIQPVAIEKKRDPDREWPFHSWAQWRPDDGR